MPTAFSVSSVQFLKPFAAMSQAWLHPPASSTSASSSRMPITRKRLWLQPAAASSSGGTPSTTTKILKLQRAAARSYKRPRLLSSSVSQASRAWICPTGGRAVRTREAKLEMTAVLMATSLTSSRTFYSAKGADPARLKKLFRNGFARVKTISLAKHVTYKSSASSSSAIGSTS